MRSIEEMRAVVAKSKQEDIDRGYCAMRQPTAPAPFTRDLLEITLKEARPFFTRLAKLILDSDEIPHMDSDKLQEWLVDFQIAGMSKESTVNWRARRYEAVLHHVLRNHKQPWSAATVLHLLYEALKDRDWISLYDVDPAELDYDFDEEYAKAKGLYDRWQTLRLQNLNDD
ncbi:hypothetical protein [Sporosarcina newyorkensis]|uniref:Uncharacterized protein n=1 Tax=Sporosarcina newyorkensis TaxID=759851 RepID=A0A1T4XGP2_9BACL|nr:hypothetical protein [Sporosarcina newyorkensis]SKA88772.1 hypothetical protein SAMN04244570_0738 [Sporosarcina newyorkensis]